MGLLLWPISRYISSIKNVGGPFRSVLSFVNRRKIVLSVEWVILRSARCIIRRHIHSYPPFNMVGTSFMPLGLGLITLYLLFISVIFLLYAANSATS